MKLAIVTRADSKIDEMTRITHPSIKRYASRCGAEFIVLDEVPLPYDDPLARQHYRILSLKEILNEYNQVLSMDSDVLVRDDCPDLFGIVDPFCVASVFEDKGTREQDRRNRMANIQGVFGDVGWRCGYINTGCFMVSARHAEIFEPYDGRLWMSLGYDDVHLGWMIHRKKFGIHELSYHYNHMSIFSENWNGSPSRLDSYIIHYAGGGRFPGTGHESADIKQHQLKLIREDAIAWNQSAK